MELQKIQLQPEAKIELTQTDLRILSDAAGAHHDPACKATLGEGGILFELTNRMAWMATGKSHRYFTTSELDLLMKVMEANPAMMCTTSQVAQQYNDDRKAVSEFLLATFNKLNDEYVNHNKI